MAPRRMDQADDALELFVFPSALGWMGIVGRAGKLSRLAFGFATKDDAMEHLARGVDGSATWRNWSRALVARLQAYAIHGSGDFSDVPLDTSGMSAFRRRVIARCRRIGSGDTLSYGRLAAAAGAPGAARAVGSVMSSNRCPLVVPCHRVVNADGSLGKFSAPQGTRMKQRLLQLERTARSETSRVG